MCERFLSCLFFTTITPVFHLQAFMEKELRAEKIRFSQFSEAHVRFCNDFGATRVHFLSFSKHILSRPLSNFTLCIRKERKKKTKTPAASENQDELSQLTFER